jgi:pimeloyl-ACP methyl ester carboxylesterase
MFAKKDRAFVGNPAGPGNWKNQVGKSVSKKRRIRCELVALGLGAVILFGLSSLRLLAAIQAPPPQPVPPGGSIQGGAGGVAQPSRGTTGQPAPPTGMPAPGGTPGAKPAPAPGTQPAPSPPPAKPPATPPAKKKVLPNPEEVSLRTNEPGGSVELHATFYPGSNGKESVPIILLHSWKGSRADFAPLVPGLHEKGHALLVPDLRGHGLSRRRIVASPRGLVTETLDAERFRPADFGAMVQYDLEAWKRFLLERNDAEALNIERLCVIGAEMGAGVALNWALLDWSWPQYPGMKQGQDVKALVLLSPQWNFRGLEVQRALNHPYISSTMSIMLIVGAGDSRALQDADRILGFLERARPGWDKLPGPARSLFFGKLNTSLQGTRLLGVQGLNVEEAISRFIELRLVKQDFPWRKRLTKEK